jgi:hypothetical protein
VRALGRRRGPNVLDLGPAAPGMPFLWRSTLTCGLPGLCCRWRLVRAGLLPTPFYCCFVRVFGGRRSCSYTAGYVPRSAVTISVPLSVLGTLTVVVDMLLLVVKLPSAVVAGYLLLLVSVSPGCGLLPG